MDEKSAELGNSSRRERLERLQRALPDRLRKTAWSNLWRYAVLAGVVGGLGYVVFNSVPYPESKLTWWFWPVVGLPIALVGGWLANRRLNSARQVLLATSEATRRDWQAIDGLAEVPKTFDDALTRLGDRDDDLATGLRLGWQLTSSHAAGVDLNDLAAEIARWSPGDQFWIARRARLLSRMAYLDGVDEIETARAATLAISIPPDRARAEASLAIEMSIRHAADGRDWMQPLLDARRRLKPWMDDVLRGTPKKRRRVFERLAVWVALCVAFGGFMSVTTRDPALDLTFASGSGFYPADASTTASAVAIVVNGVRSSAVVGGPLSDTEIETTIEASSPVELIWIQGGLQVQTPAGVGVDIQSIAVLVGPYEASGQERALLGLRSATGRTATLHLGTYNGVNIEGQFPTSAYLVALPKGTMDRLLAQIHPAP